MVELEGKVNTRLFFVVIFLGMLSSVLIAGVLVRRNIWNREGAGKQDVKIGEENDVGKDEEDSLLADFPLYTGMEISESFFETKDEGRGLSTSFETTDAPSQAFLFYKTNLPSAGWNLVSTNEAEVSYTISFEKEDRVGFIGITRAGKATVVSVTIGKRRI